MSYGICFSMIFFIITFCLASIIYVFLILLYIGRVSHIGNNAYNPFLYTLKFVYGFHCATAAIWYVYYNSISLTSISSFVYELWYSTWIYGSASISSDMASLLYSYCLYSFSFALYTNNNIPLYMVSGILFENDVVVE